MSELPAISGRDAIKTFEKLGFQTVRSKGSHFVLSKPGYKYNLTVPVHGNRPLKPGTLRRLIRDSGATVDEFVACIKA